MRIGVWATSPGFRAEKAALVLVARVFGEFLGELVKVRALVAETLDEVLGLFLGLHEDVADLVFRVAVGGLLTVVGGLHVLVGNGIGLGPVLNERVDEDLFAGGVDRFLHVGAAFKLGLLGFLQENRLLDEGVLHLTFEFGTRGLTLTDGAVVDGFLFGDRNGFAVHLEGLQFGVGRTGGHQGGKAENEKFFLHDLFSFVGSESRRRFSGSGAAPARSGGIKEGKSFVRPSCPRNFAPQPCILPDRGLRQL